MISNDMLKELEIGAVIQSRVPKKKYDYVSYANRNGSKDQIFSLKDLGSMIEWLFVGINFVGKKKFIKCIEKDPVFCIEFRGAIGANFCEKELSNIVRHWFARTFAYPRSIKAEDINQLLGVEVNQSNKRYTFNGTDYSPQSFVKSRTAYKGDRVKHLAYSYNSNELPTTSATDIVFLDKSYWLASKTVAVESDCAYFGLGEVTADGCVNMGHSLYKSTGEILGGTNAAHIRSVIYIEPERYSLIKLNSGAYGLVES